MAYHDDYMQREREVRAAEEANFLKKTELYLDVIKKLWDAGAIDKEEYVKALNDYRQYYLHKRI